MHPRPAGRASAPLRRRGSRRRAAAGAHALRQFSPITSCGRTGHWLILAAARSSSGDLWRSTQQAAHWPARPLAARPATAPRGLHQNRVEGLVFGGPPGSRPGYCFDWVKMVEMMRWPEGVVQRVCRLSRSGMPESGRRCRGSTLDVGRQALALQLEGDRPPKFPAAGRGVPISFGHPRPREARPGLGVPGARTGTWVRADRGVDGRFCTGCMYSANAWAVAVYPECWSRRNHVRSRLVSRRLVAGASVGI